MDINFYIALYGALLSTGLFIHKILKERKKLSIILEHIAWYERVQIVITNTGYRPITLTALAMKTVIGEGDVSHWEPVPNNSLFDIESGNDPFPILIKEGEAISLPLGPVLSETLLQNGLKAKLIVFDSRGKEYSVFTTRTFDAKWGGYFNV
ncbi:MAG: hypothetical protein SCH68_12010 [Brevefilum sp.]|nr:hypothetical protein [Brevefilum sp.]